MSYRFPARAQPVLQGKTRVIEPRSTYEINGTIRQSAPSHRGDRVDHVPKVLFTVLQVRIEAGILPRDRGLRSPQPPPSHPLPPGGTRLFLVFLLYCSPLPLFVVHCSS